MPVIAIDACVFMHMMNSECNDNEHIDDLLKDLSKNHYNLLVDSTGRIGKDYKARIIPIFQKTNDTGVKLQILRYWMLSPSVTVQLDQADHLMSAIKGVIHEREEHADRAFVYVACRQDSTLVTNDEVHILKRCTQLLNRTKKHRGRNTKILSSKNAKLFFCPDGDQP